MYGSVPLICVLTSALLSGYLPQSTQEPGRIKVAEGEYRVTTQDDLGVGPIETEVFHFRESWTLWRVAGEFEIEGERFFESPLGTPHDNQFTARFTHDFRLISVKEFARLDFRKDSGPLTCQFLPSQLRCDSGAKDPAQDVDVQVPMDRPYGLLWPLSAFSLASLTRGASADVGKAVPIEVVQLEQLNYELPVLLTRSDGLIRYLGRSKVVMTVSGETCYPQIYEVTAPPIRKLTLWLSPEGLLLAAEKPSLPKGRMELVRFTKFVAF